MKIDDLTICPALFNCYIAKINKNGLISSQRKALTDHEMAQVVAFYGSERLENGYSQTIPIDDGTKVVIAHIDSDKELTIKKKLSNKQSKSKENGENCNCN